LVVTLAEREDDLDKRDRRVMDLKAETAAGDDVRTSCPNCGHELT
jgi:hypothetical protein